MNEATKLQSASRPKDVPLMLDEKGVLYQNVKEYLALQHLYNSAIREIRTKLEVLSDEFQVNYARNPIHHIESRLKSPRSIIEKLKRRGYEVSLSSAREHLSDLAGIRVVCCYIDDCYRVAEMLLRQNDLRLVHMDDYIKEPLKHGYRSLHLDMEVPIYLSERTEPVVTEIQIRTVAMDFWASLEHDMRYKCSAPIPPALSDQMADCAHRINEIDREMQAMFEKVSELQKGM